ncbi:TIR domain-containing protein [Leptospira kanakyensis]|uniref:TIR domain-containing protein n=1 Tax=Leptospira kanakyensis TaxID=2484968 RepID=UPI00223C9ACE|nr:TIR domain-containing protein [Leptospira kanakyensis]MCW7480350.1 nucleotide-binding protein [Leptospira kanakyensis]
MILPIRTTVEDVETLCRYLLKKPTGANIKEAKTVLDSKYLDGRKLSALKVWGLIEDNNDKLKLTEIGRKVGSQDETTKVAALQEIIRNIAPYFAIIEKASHNGLKSFTNLEVSAHWHDHFKEISSSNDKILSDQAVCFFQLADGAKLGEMIVGRKGSNTRFEFNKTQIEIFISNQPYINTSDPQNSILDTNKGKTEQFDQNPQLKDLGQNSSKLGEGIFIAHGKNKKPLEQLKKILDQFKIPYKVAVEEPNLGRPISLKIKETMAACNCAILIFTADEEFQDLKGKSIWRPSENVIFELGAAGYLYDKRIVILKEDSVEFASNFKDIGYISFEKDQLESQSMAVFKELIGFGILKIST